MYIFYSEFVSVENVLSYTQHRSELVTKWRGLDFDEAVNFCDEFIRNPKVHSFNIIELKFVFYSFVVNISFESIF